MNDFDFYIKQSKYSSPGKYESLYKELPHNLEGLTSTIRGVIVHQHETEKYYGFRLPEGREIEPNTRYMEKILDKIIGLDDSPLTMEREPQKRFIGLCRDFALMLCSVLRYQGTPARVRCGFANYFHEKEHVDHWVCEYWNKDTKKWVLVDVEVGKDERKHYSIPDSFNNLDIDHDQFWLSSTAWKKIRNGEQDPNLFGVTSIDITGAWFVRANLFRDLAALNKIELCPWDYTKHSDKKWETLDEMPENELEKLDNLAELIRSNDIERIREFYNNNLYFQAKSEITSYTNLGPRKIYL